MPNKPDKFGIKYWVLTDVKSKYCLNALPYCGKDDARKSNQSQGEFVVLRLAEPYKNDCINITCNNYFSSIILAEKLKKNNKNRRDLLQFNVCNEVSSSNEIHSTRVYENSQGHILTDYQAKKNKNVLLLNTMNQDVIIYDTQKENHTQFYSILWAVCAGNILLVGLQGGDLHMYFFILDLASINSWVLFKETTGCKLSRKAYIQRLVREMVGSSFAKEPSTS
ncbi:hypothetical protein J437_LFUL011606 [Ladona fulva]|uniref:PiggyBac transposable element-derived protein domain-containing protein n=1 Tax=Ladona fulva TaxID=123851 RepID=A0A8K0KAW2_LADFU|nr:hypothetical protein J437_LFUL011606 [Ladona fulva]